MAPKCSILYQKATKYQRGRQISPLIWLISYLQTWFQFTIIYNINTNILGCNNDMKESTCTFSAISLFNEVCRESRTLHIWKSCKMTSLFCVYMTVKTVRRRVIYAKSDQRAPTALFRHCASVFGMLNACKGQNLVFTPCACFLILIFLISLQTMMMKHARIFYCWWKKWGTYDAELPYSKESRE